VSYLHCPRCQHAYNVAVQPACPTCVTDPTDDIVAAADQLARALARANTDQLAAAEARVGEGGGTILRALRSAVPTAGPQQAILATVALALLTRLAPPRKTIAARAASWSARARALLARAL
jgi:hypothetical protein